MAKCSQGMVILARAWEQGIGVYALIRACYSTPQAMVAHAYIHVYRCICYHSYLSLLSCRQVLTHSYVSIPDHYPGHALM